MRPEEDETVVGLQKQAFAQQMLVAQLSRVGGVGEDVASCGAGKDGGEGGTTVAIDCKDVRAEQTRSLRLGCLGAG